MASQFIGLHMSVMLREPPGYRISGVVRDVEAGSSLTLTDVFIAPTKERAPQMIIDASNIADLSEVAIQQASPTKQAFDVRQDSRSPLVETLSQPQLSPHPPQPQQRVFADPAILSVGRRSSSNTPSMPTPRKRDLSERANSAGPGAFAVSRGGVPPQLKPEQIILDSIQGMRVSEGSRSGDQTPTALATPSQKKNKSRSKNPKSNKTSNKELLRHDQEEDGSNANGHGKGWRQTPIIQSTASFQPFNSLKKSKSRKLVADNGWASEEVTEEMGDFDFENNLAKFDKRTIFDQMRKDDEVDESERLVSHNRRPKPGTAGGKNYHYTEMVLEPQSSLGGQNTDFWNSEADVGVNESGRLSGREARSGAASGARIRAESKSGPSRRSQSRKGSGIMTTTTTTTTTSQPLSRVNSFQRIEQPGLYLVSSNRRLEVISTLQMLNVENIAANELGFSETLMAENAGRGIAEVAIGALSDPATKVRFRLALGSSGADLASSLDTSTIVILASNSKSGVRALAAARHLRNKNFDVSVCLVGVEREKDLLEDLRGQMQLYRAFGGKVHSKNDFFKHLRESAASGTPVSVSLIIDALLGLTTSFEELRNGDQATVYELMEWANRNEAFALSVDVPTGINPSSGKIAIIDGTPLYVKPRYVVAIGAPKRGLLEAVTPPRDGEPGASNSAALEDEWRLFIADMGLGSAVWRKAGTKIRKGVDFDGKWVLEMRYRGADVDYDED